MCGVLLPDSVDLGYINAANHISSRIVLEYLGRYGESREVSVTNSMYVLT